MARLKKGKIKRSAAGKAFRNWDTDYLGKSKGKKGSVPPALNTRKFGK